MASNQQHEYNRKKYKASYYRSFELSKLFTNTSIVAERLITPPVHRKALRATMTAPKMQHSVGGE
jgi:hypothetical protein